MYIWCLYLSYILYVLLNQISSSYNAVATLYLYFHVMLGNKWCEALNSLKETTKNRYLSAERKMKAMKTRQMLINLHRKH